MNVTPPNWNKHADTVIELVLKALGQFLFSLLGRKKENRVTYKMKSISGETEQVGYVDITGLKAKEITADYVLRLVVNEPAIWHLEIVSIAPNRTKE